MVDVTQIPYNLASGTIRGVYDSAIDGASDLVDDTLESVQNSLTISTQFLNNRLSSAYTEVVKIPDVIADILFGPTSISSQARRILGDTAEVAKRSWFDPAWDAASRAARGIWNALPDIPGIDVEETVKSIASGIYTYIFGEDEVASVPETTAASNLISGAEELTRQVVAKIDAGTQTSRMARSSTGSVSSAFSSAAVVSTSLSSLSAPTTESGSGSSIVIASIPPSTDEVASASALATSVKLTVVTGAPAEGTTGSNADGVEVSEGESSPGVLQTILNFLTGTSPNTSSASNSSTQNSSATAQTVGGLGVFGIGGNSGTASSGARSSSPIPSVENMIPRRVVSSLGGGSQSTTLRDFVLGIITGDSEASNITSIPSGLSVPRTLFHAAVSRVLDSNGDSIPSYRRGSSLGSSIPQVVVTAGLNNLADISYVPYSGNVSSRVSLGQSDPSSSNLETGEVASNLTDGVYGLHFPTDANPDSGFQGGEQNAYETMRDLEQAENLNIPSLDQPSVVVDPSFIITQSRQVSVAV